MADGSKVLLVRDGALVEQAVRTGIKGWEFVEITHGLAKGDAVVVSLDQAQAQAGAKVRIAGEALR